MRRPAITREQYNERAAKLARTIADMLNRNVWPVRVKRSCMYGDPAKVAATLNVACVFWNYRDVEPEYQFTYTPEPINRLEAADGRLIFEVLRRGPIRASSEPLTVGAEIKEN